MKVDNNVPVRTRATRSGRSTSGGTAAFSAELETNARAPAVSGGVPIGGAAAIMALQEMADHGEGRGKAMQRGRQLLDLLDELRLGLLTGGFSAAALDELSRLAAQARERVDSPDLQQVLDEIDLRVQVELAKYHPTR